MNYVALFFIMLAGNIIGHYICKFIESKQKTS